jgi:uncharacterized LabA/DUF88 family protein
MRAAIFIDGGYFEKVLVREFGMPKIDFQALSSQMVGRIGPSVELLRTYYYHCLPYQSNPPTEEESRRYSQRRGFYQALERLPKYCVKYGRLVRRGPDKDGQYDFEQKRVDALLSVDLVKLAATSQITHAAILAGDSDLIPAVEAAKESGVSVYLFHGQEPHQDLWKAADMRAGIDQALIDACLLC